MSILKFKFKFENRSDQNQYHHIIENQRTGPLPQGVPIGKILQEADESRIALFYKARLWPGWESRDSP